MTSTSTTNRCRWKAAKHNGQPCPYHSALQRMAAAASKKDYAAYEVAREDAKRHEGVEAASGLQKFMRDLGQKATPANELAAVEAKFDPAFEYDRQRRPDIMDDAQLVAEHNGAKLLDTGFTLRRSGIGYHSGDEPCSREKMIAKVDELFLAGRYAQARGLHEDLSAIDARMLEKGWMLEASLDPQATIDKILDQAARLEQPAKELPEIDFDAELLVAPRGLVKTFSTGGGEWYAKHRLGLTAQDLEGLTPELVADLSARNNQYRQDVLDALRITSDQETRESIAMPFIHAVEFDDALNNYPAGPYRQALKAEVAGMLQYASRLAKYQAGRKHADDTDIFVETRLGDIAAPVSDESPVGTLPLSVAEKLIANGVSRQIAIDAGAYDDELWGSYFQEAQKYYR